VHKFGATCLKVGRGCTRPVSGAFKEPAIWNMQAQRFGNVSRASRTIGVMQWDEAEEELQY
jgi:hypothetical protein